MRHLQAKLTSASIIIMYVSAPWTRCHVTRTVAWLETNGLVVGARHLTRAAWVHCRKTACCGCALLLACAQSCTAIALSSFVPVCMMLLASLRQRGAMVERLATMRWQIPQGMCVQESPFIFQIVMLIRIPSSFWEIIKLYIHACIS